MAENTDDAIDELKDDNNQEHDYSRPRQRLLTVLGSVVMVVINRFLVYKYLSYGNRLRDKKRIPVTGGFKRENISCLSRMITENETTIKSFLICRLPSAE